MTITLFQSIIKNLDNFSKYHSNDIAIFLKEIYNKEGSKSYIKYIKQIPDEFLGEILLKLPSHIKDIALEELSVNSLVEAVDELSSDDATDLMHDIEDIDKDKEKEILLNLDKDDLENIQKLKKYEEDEAGSLMQTELFSVKLDDIIYNSIQNMKILQKEKGLNNIHQAFILNKQGILIGSIDIEKLITFDFKNKFEYYKNEFNINLITVIDRDDVNTVLKVFEDYNLIILPVLNNKKQLIGRITSNNIYETIEERATNQMYNMAGVDDEVEEEHNIISSSMNRASWLALNLITAILASLIIGIFNETLQSYIALAILMPIVASMGGNAGTQSLTIMVRQIALGELVKSNVKKEIIKEIIISLINGLIFSLAMGIIAFIWFNNGMLGVVIGLSLIINLLIAGIFGASIPIVLNKFGNDPAISSTVILTTVTDIVGFFTFLGLAKIIL